jgi:exonuclease SbcC
MCPFLREPCRNLRPGVSLDGHFDGVITETNSELGVARSRLAEVEAALQQARVAEKAVSRLPDLERRLGQLGEEQARLREEVQALERRQSELAGVPQEELRLREEIGKLAPELARAEAASRVAGGEEGWRRQAESSRQAVEREELALAEIRALLERETGAAEALATADRALAELQDPRAEVDTLRRRIARERPGAEQALENARRELQKAQAAEEQARAKLEPYARLEEEMSAAGALRDQNESAHRSFLAHQGEAARLPERQQAARQAGSEVAQAAERLTRARQGLERARAAYDETEHFRLRVQLEEVADGIGQGRKAMEMYQQEEGHLLLELEELRRRKAEMETAQRESQEARRLRDAVEAVRDVLRRAGPEMTRELLRRISARATALYRELLAQPTVSLEWGADYEIRCRVRAEEREFKQLSGGEQMAAALAVRLALLQTLSNLKLAFLDEPTAHMDAVRRMNLAAQIQNLRTFDQLLVISHDDSFDTLFGHVVRLAKRDGKTIVEV